MPTNIDQLQIEIETKSDGAVKGLRELKKALNSLKQLGKSTELDDLATKLEKISKIRFDNLKQINKLGETFKQVNRLTKDVKDLSAKMSNIPSAIGSGADTSAIGDALESIETVSSAIAGLPDAVTISIDTPGAEEAASNARELVENLALLGDGTGAEESIASTREIAEMLVKSSTNANLLDMELDSVLRKLASMVTDPTADNGTIARLVRKAQKLQAEIDKTGKKFKKFGDTAHKSTRKAQGGLAQLLKIVAVYGTAFRLWSAFTNGIGEGLKNIAGYNDETNAAMSKLSTMALQLKNSIGAALYPVIVAITPALKAMADAIIKALNAFNQFVAVLSGKNTYIRAKEYLKEYGDTAKKTASEIKKSFAGMDEITVIGEKDSGSSNEDNPADMFEEVQIDDSFRKSLSDVLGVIGAIGAGIAAWAIPTTVLKGIEWLSKLKSANFSWGFSIAGGLAFIDDLNDIRDAIKDIVDNGANFDNVTKLLGNFAGAMGDVLIMLGNLKTGAALKAVDGILEIVRAIKSMSEEGVNFDNVSTLVKGIGSLTFAFGAFNGNFKAAGIGLIITGLSNVIGELDNVMEAIRTGDWSGVDKVTLIIGGVEMLGGLLVALDVFSKIKGAVNTGKAATDVAEVATVTETVGETTSTLTSKLGKLAKNLGLGIAIIAEVAVAAGLIVGAIWGLGVLLEQVGKAWQPVIDNGGTIATAMGIGLGLLVAIGLVTAGLGTLGTALIAPLGLGIAILAEIGAAAVLFLAEILAVGVMLDKIGVAWKPVLDNGETIEQGILIGTGLLIAIGVVTAALGVATVASAGLLPLAIGLGTALLVELAAAFVVFCESLIDVADELVELSTPMDELNEILPGLKLDMDDFTAFMGDFAGAVVKFTAASAIAGIAATIDKVISFFTTDPVQRMYEEVTDQTKEFKNLIPALEKINPMIERATELVGTYKENMGSFESATGGSGGFLNSIVNGAKGVVNGMISLFEGMVNGIIRGVNGLIRGLNKISFDVPDWVPEIGGKKLGFNIKQLTEVTLPRFQTGGFPEDGLFMANHGELVGKFSNGKTAVANNEQIVEGIASGVYTANQEQNRLLVEQNKLLRQLVDNKSNGQIDVTTITSAMLRKNRRDGKTIVPVGI